MATVLVDGMGWKAYPNVTTIERYSLSPEVEDIVYDTDLEEFFGWDGDFWLQIMEPVCENIAQWIKDFERLKSIASLKVKP